MSNLSMVSTPTQALLPGRTRWLCVCHAEPQECDVCLAAIAGFLAEEMEYDLARAMDKPAEAYQAELGAERCSLERAAELRRMTVRSCADGGSVDWVLAEFYVENVSLPEMRRVPGVVKFVLWWMAAMVMLVLGVLG